MYIYSQLHSTPQNRVHGAIGEIDGPESPQRVKDISEAPYRWICALDLSFSSGVVRGTGLLISPRHVLTAARNFNKKIKTSTGESPVDAQKVIVTPGLDGAKLLGKQRAPVGSIELKPGDWWIPNQYLSGIFGWNMAVLTLPSELPAVSGMSYGHWSDARFAPRTTIAAVTATSLVGATVSVCGYPADKGRASTQSEAFSKIQPAVPSVEGDLILYEGETSREMAAGAPVWQKQGGLRLLAIHLFSDAPLPNPKTSQPERYSGGLLMRTEIVDALRQRILLEGIRPTF